MSTHIPPYEPPNKTPQEEYESVCPPSLYPSGEEPVAPDDVFLDTGSTMESFVRASKQVAEFLHDI